MEADVNEDMAEMAEWNSLYGDRKYMDITKRDTTIMAHDGAEPSQKIVTPSAYYKEDQAK